MDPIEELLSISDFKEFREQMKTFTRIDEAQLIEQWRIKHKTKPAASTVTNRVVDSTTKKVITETSKTTTLDK